MKYTISSSKTETFRTLKDAMYAAHMDAAKSHLTVDIMRCGERCGAVVILPHGMTQYIPVI